MSCPLVLVFWLEKLAMIKRSGVSPRGFDDEDEEEEVITAAACPDEHPEHPVKTKVTMSKESVERDRNLFLAKSYLAEVITADLREIIQGSAKKLVKENELIEELQDRISNYEDHIQCLEQLVKELQLMLRNALGKENSISSDEGSIGSQGKARTHALKTWFSRPLDESKQSGSPQSQPGNVLEGTLAPKREKMAHKHPKATHSSSQEGVLDDFIY